MGTLQLALITVFFGTVIGSLLAMARLSKYKVINFVVGAYVEVIVVLRF